MSPQSPWPPAPPLQDPSSSAPGLDTPLRVTFRRPAHADGDANARPDQGAVRIRTAIDRVGGTVVPGPIDADGVPRLTCVATLRQLFDAGLLSPIDPTEVVAVLRRVGPFRRMTTGDATRRIDALCRQARDQRRWAAKVRLALHVPSRVVPAPPRTAPPDGVAPSPRACRRPVHRRGLQLVD
jgi:hypothetical protein